MWTRFVDMNSGGGQKLDWKYIYIEAPIDEAIAVFYNRFERNPNRVTCTCCGEDYSIREYPDLHQATGFERGCKHDNNGYIEAFTDNEFSFAKRYIPLEEYIKKPGILVMPASEIKDEWRQADVPSEGYVWAGG